MRGIEPPPEAWEASVLPLNYIRTGATILVLLGLPGLRCLPGDHHLLQDLGRVPSLDVGVGPAFGDTVAEHHVAERAADPDDVGAHRKGLVHAVAAHLLAVPMLHPIPAPAASA